MPYCKSCGAPIVFIRSAKNNRPMPCNAEKIEYKAGYTPDYEDWVVNDEGELIQCTFDFQCQPDGLARLPHWATCPYADQHRKR